MVTASCNKPASIPLEQDVIFKAATIENGFKSADNSCINGLAHYALISIQPLEADGITAIGDPITKTTDIFYLNGTMYTNTLKLAPGKYNVTAFVLMNDGVDNLSETEDDETVYATPENGSTFGQLISSPLPLMFEVGAFMKNEVNLEVLCFDEVDYDKFGFAWFAIDYVTVGNNDDLVFFGDFCTKYFADYEANDIYRGQTGDLSHDMVAIFKIKVYKDGNRIGAYDNEDWFGEGKPLIVPNPDDPNIQDEEFKYKLFILVKSGSGFVYKKFFTWTIIDNAPLPNIGENNVMEFVLGSCTPDADLILPPYMNLPESATMTTISYVPGNLGTYFDVNLSDIGYGYDIQNGNYGVYCGDITTSITLNKTYNMNVFSSLYLDLIPDAFNLQKSVLDNINWLGNNLYRYEDHTWRDIQNAVWMLLGQITETQNGGVLKPTPIAIKMKNDAFAYGDDYNPPVGGYAAVLFISPNATSTYRDLQLLFTLVDP